MVNWHKFFTSILDTISDGVFISDAMGTTLYVNQMYADLVGVPAGTCGARTCATWSAKAFSTWP